MESNNDKQNVTIIDDDEDILFFLKKAIERRFSVHVATFAEAESALKFLKEGNICHCVVSDYQMPTMNGIEFAKELASLKLGIPLIILTGYGTPVLERTAFKSDCYEFVSKPIDDKFYQALENSLRISKLEWKDSYSI